MSYRKLWSSKLVLTKSPLIEIRQEGLPQLDVLRRRGSLGLGGCPEVIEVDFTRDYQLSYPLFQREIVCRRTQQDPDQLYGINFGATLSVVLEMNVLKSPCLSSAGQHMVKRKSTDSSPACLCQVLRGKS